MTLMGLYEEIDDIFYGRDSWPKEGVRVTEEDIINILREIKDTEECVFLWKNDWLHQTASFKMKGLSLTCITLIDTNGNELSFERYVHQVFGPGNHVSINTHLYDKEDVLHRLRGKLILRKRERIK